MCTLTWWQDRSRYALFFNRDELKSRLPATPPEIRIDGGVRFITPIDGDSGGTWMLANEFGLCVALLNFYDADLSRRDSSAGNHVSRGHLVLSLASAHDAAAAAERLAGIALERYRPFHLFAIDPGRAPQFWTWPGGDGQLIARAEPRPPITTSSFDTGGVCARRQAVFESAIERNGLNLEALESFHHFVDAENGAYSVRMRRPDAQTVSYNRVDVDAESGVRFRYRPEPRDSLAINDGVEVALPLRPAGSGSD